MVWLRTQHLLHSQHLRNRRNAMKRFAYLLALVLCLGVAAEAQAQTTAPASAPKSSVHGYRLLYTLSESDSGKKIGVQHFMLTVNNDSGRADLKIGSKVPISTGGVSKD